MSLSRETRSLLGSVTEDSVKVGQDVAREVFRKRGNHTEIHIREVDLAALIAVGFEAGKKYAEKADREGPCL